MEYWRAVEQMVFLIELAPMLVLLMMLAFFSLLALPLRKEFLQRPRILFQREQGGMLSSISRSPI